MIKKLLTGCFLMGTAAVLPFTAHSQSIPFTNQTALLPSSVFHSGNVIGISDMNNDGKDDIVRDSNNIRLVINYQQMPNAMFTESHFPGITFGSPWGLCIGDYDNNGFNDVFQGSSTSGYLLTADATGTSYTRENMTTIYGGGNVFTQGCNFADIDNDGYLDLFIDHDIGMPKIYKGNGAPGGWVFNQALIDMTQVPASDNSGNYASLFTDVNADGLIDLMITHCRQGVTNSADARRIDQVFINNGNGTYTQDVTNWTNLRDGEQGWSTAWGDIDNDGDMDAFVLNQTVNGKLMINNGSGVFTDTMSTSGIANPTTWFGETAMFYDFDNDTYLDLMISGDEHFLYKGNGNGTFTVQSNPFVYGTNDIRSFAVGDLNNDGFMDMYASYCNLYITPSSSRNDRLWMNDCPNNGNTNHWVKFNLTGGATTGMSNKNGIGAIVKIYGAWGVQVREVRSGEGYGLHNTFTVHFGLGTATQIDSVVVIWPSGIVDQSLVIPADQTVFLLEGGSPLSTHSAIEQTLELNVYPNPVTDEAVIRLDHFASVGLKNLSVNVYDLNGKVVYSESALQRSIIILDRSMFTSGMYLVEVTNNNERVATKKMMIQ
ncbi:MAG: FG-GAP-like repeat-containing protein [Bacteroidota bacterium]|nr:FG-GAP-like repeat-containing protein [Bacteroidota bacterium]